jgi:hypothetical protein
MKKQFVRFYFCMHTTFVKLTFFPHSKLKFWQFFTLAFHLIYRYRRDKKILRVSRKTPKRGGSLTKK